MTTTKFAYRHIPSGQWAFLDREDLCGRIEVYLTLIDWVEYVLYAARNIIEEDMASAACVEPGISKSEFELVEFEVEYKEKIK